MRRQRLWRSNRTATIAAACCTIWLLAGRGVGRAHASAATPTFAGDVAPIVFEHCTPCHRPGGPAPFSLVSYQDASRRATLIQTAVTAHVMPPWKPEPGRHEFAGERRLSAHQIATIARWAASGAPEGDPNMLPPLPHFAEGWQLGEPDLIVTMPEPYTLPADGPDVFRNFVIPVASSRLRYVAGWEFRPGNPAVVHHATMHFDATRTSRQLDAQDPGPGYEGLAPFTLRDPDGYFLGWTPGQRADTGVPDAAWTLDTGNDLVLMLHLKPTGKREVIQASLGLYFTETPPAKVPVLLRVGRQDIDIPAGDAHHVVTASYTVPVDVEIHTVYPHAHYRAKQIEGYATLPDGTARPLLSIRDWDFNWQEVYRFKVPVPLPAGSTVSMTFTYDNSAQNPRNPFRPPRRAMFGKASSDEMGDLWIQVVPRRTSERTVLTADYARRLLPATIAGLEMMVKAEPDSRALHDELALVYEHAGILERVVAHFTESLRLAPNSAVAHYNLGSTLMRSGREDAREHLERAVALDPDYAAAHNNLGVVLLQSGDPVQAARHYREVLRLEPGDPDAHYNLGLALQAQGRVDDAIGRFKEALQLRAEFPSAHFVLGRALAAQGRTADAIQQYREALRDRPDWPQPLLDLAWVLGTTPDSDIRRPGEALALAERASRIAEQPRAPVLDVVAAALAALGEFDRAVMAAETALALSANDEGEARQIRARLDLYRQRKPYIAPAR